MAISISDDPPIIANTGDLWWESDAGKLKIYYSADNGLTAQWVDVMPQSVYGGGGGGLGGGGSASANMPFEDFVSANLGNRKALIWDFAPPTGVGKSSKPAGIRGSHYLNLADSNLYEKTGDNNDTDWAQIAFLGQPRDYAAGEDYYVQFNSGDRLAGVPNYIYNYDIGLTSGASGHFDNLSAEYGFISKDLVVSGDLYVTGTTHVTKVLDYTIQGDISGKEFYADNVYIKGLDVDDAIYNLSGKTVATFSSMHMNMLDLEDDLVNLSGRSVATFSDISYDLIDLSDDVISLSGRSIATFADFAYHIDRLEEFSGQSIATIADIYYELDNISSRVAGDFTEQLASGLENVSGESLANFIALSDDLELLEDDVLVTSGEAVANFIALSDDITLLKEDITTLSTPLVYTKANLPASTNDGTLALVTDGSLTNLQVMAYHYNGFWYRVTDNSQIT